jgi:hypothetical protein
LCLEFPQMAQRRLCDKHCGQLVEQTVLPSSISNSRKKKAEEYLPHPIRFKGIERVNCILLSRYTYMHLASTHLSVYL